MTDPAVTVLADDLSGAAETAGKFLGERVPVTLCLDPTTTQADTGITVFDLDTRAMTVPEAQRTLRAAVAALGPEVVVLKKIDSLLRGHIGPEVDCLRERGPVIVAAALPALNRTVEGGVLHLDGVALHRTAAWAVEDAAPPRSVDELFGTAHSESVPAGGDPRPALSAGRIAICDAASDSDLDEIVRASRGIPGIQLVGTAALAAAVARILRPATPCAVHRRRNLSLLTVVGTAAAQAAEQVSRLVAHGSRLLTVDAETLRRGTADPTDIARALDHGSVVLTLAGDIPPGNSRPVCAALGQLVAAGQAHHRPDLILTGGETARAVVDAIGLTTLRPIHEVHHGAVVSVASDGRSVATRPGSFGDRTSLTAIAEYLASRTHVHPQPKDKS
ncbi:four-carbon acid sugar kinase family protein [Mycobacterium sp. 21AC1]|uniref:four-carbon acid sugar kinase family protein n=1 Tax=[Mycobacterium] appelbergii TaxID=2939269 RepID=UPI0029390C05|nr:four-carbon acid sugar kinase family protein [Mycobacterium sp. 21AC1]MDV3123670.1 four-carbon acid sugar kinase family protein [Mycobacterium sp. 21AC1]